MSVVSFRLREDLKKRMERLKYINWSEVVRRAIERRLELEARLGSERTMDRVALAEMLKKIERLRERTSGKWSGTEEIRKWREIRK